MSKENIKELKLSFTIKVPIDTNPLRAQDSFFDFIEQNGWKIIGGGMKYPNSDNELVENEIKERQRINKENATKKNV